MPTLDRLIHEVLLGDCIHRQWEASTESGHDWLDVSVTCTKCAREIGRRRFDTDTFFWKFYPELDLIENESTESYERRRHAAESEARKRAREHMNSIDWPPSGYVFESGLQRFSACDDARCRELVRRLEARGWHFHAVHRNGKFHGALVKGEMQFLAPPIDTYERAAFQSAVMAARHVSPNWRP